MPEPAHLSYSSISSYLLCGEAWRRRYVAGEQAPVSDNLVLGSAFHGAVESYLKGAPDLEAAFVQSWGQQLERNQNIAWESGVPEPTHDTGLRMVRAKPVKKLLDEVRQNFDAEHGLIERRVELHVPGVPVPIIGYIDIVTKDGIPGDFKTAARMWADGKAEEEMQPLVYLAALNQEGINSHAWHFRHYVFSKGQSPSAKVFEVVHKPAEMLWMFSVIKSAWEGIRAGVFIKNPSTWKCVPKFCEYYASCRYAA